MRRDRKKVLMLTVIMVLVFFVMFLSLKGVNISWVMAAEICEGDFDGDGDVDGSDLAAFAADFGRTDCP